MFRGKKKSLYIWMCVFEISWSLYVTGGRSRTVGLILYRIAVRTVVKLAVTSANIATLRVRYAPMDQCVENVVSETPSAWTEFVSTCNCCWKSLRIGVWNCGAIEWGFLLTVSPYILILSILIYYTTDAQLNIPRRMLKSALKLTLKVLLHVSVQNYYH
jgi:hypothetical protein